MRQQTKITLLSIQAVALLTGLLSCGAMATYVWWTLVRGTRFCGTPRSWVALLSFLAIVLFSSLVGTLRLIIKNKSAV